MEENKENLERSYSDVYGAHVKSENEKTTDKWFKSISKSIAICFTGVVFSLIWAFPLLFMWNKFCSLFNLSEMNFQQSFCLCMFVGILTRIFAAWKGDY